MRHAARRDLNDKEITQAVRAAGFTIIDYAKAGQGIPDKLAIRLLPQISEYGQVYFICWLEIKSKHGTLSETQKMVRSIWEPRGEWIEAREAEQTVRDLMERYTAAIKPEATR